MFPSLFILLRIDHRFSFKEIAARFNTSRNKYIKLRTVRKILSLNLIVVYT